MGVVIVGWTAPTLHYQAQLHLLTVVVVAGDRIFQCRPPAVVQGVPVGTPPAQRLGHPEIAAHCRLEWVGEGVE